MATITTEPALITRHPCGDGRVHRTTETVPATVCVSGFTIVALCGVSVDLEPIHARNGAHAECRVCARAHARRLQR